MDKNRVSFVLMLYHQTTAQLFSGCDPQLVIGTPPLETFNYISGDYKEMANLLYDGLVCSSRSYKGIGTKLRLFDLCFLQYFKRKVENDMD